MWVVYSWSLWSLVSSVLTFCSARGQVGDRQWAIRWIAGITQYVRSTTLIRRLCVSAGGSSGGDRLCSRMPLPATIVSQQCPHCGWSWVTGDTTLQSLIVASRCHTVAVAASAAFEHRLLRMTTDHRFQNRRSVNRLSIHNLNRIMNIGLLWI